MPVSIHSRKEDGSPFPAKTIKLLPSGLQRHMRATSSPTFIIFNMKDHRFPLHLYTVFKKLLSEGVGAEVHHHKAFTSEDEDILWDKGVFSTDSPTGLQNAIFITREKTCAFAVERNIETSSTPSLLKSKVATDTYVERGSKTFWGGFSQLHLNARSVVLYNDADAGIRCFSVFTCPSFCLTLPMHSTFSQ